MNKIVTFAGVFDSLRVNKDNLDLQRYRISLPHDIAKGNNPELLSIINSEPLTEYLESEGAKITNSISKNTNMLIIKDESVMDTSKVKKAKDLGVNIILRDNITLN